MHSDVSSEHSDEDLVSTNYHWIRFKWMLWVACCKHWNSRWEFLFAILMPSIFSLVLVLLRIQISAEHITATTYPVEDLEGSWKQLLTTIDYRQGNFTKYYSTPIYNVFVPHIEIAYARTNPVNTKIMELAIEDLNVTLKSFTTCNELRKKMSKEYYLAGVCFKGDYNGTNGQGDLKCPRRLSFVLIFPSELRLYKTKINEIWDTTKLYKVPGRNEHINGFATYIDEGFIMLQKRISEAYLMLSINISRMEDKVYIRKFPVAEHYYDPIAEVLEMRMSLLLILGYLTTILYFLRSLVTERHKKLDCMLALLDVTPFVQFYSWFTFALISMSVGSLVLLLILKIPWNNGFAVFNNASFTCLLVFFTAFNIYALSFCFMISKFFRNAKIAICAAPIFWSLFFLPFITIVKSRSTIKETVHPVAALFGSTAFGFAIESIYHLENDEGLNWYNYFKSADLSKTNFSVGIYSIMMCAVSIVQVLIGIWVTKINKLLKIMCKKISRKKDTDRTSAEGSTRYSKTIILEVRANYKAPALEVINLKVERYNKIILENISFSLYEDEITMLMGHNGSGKTTLIQILAGIKKPKSGNIIWSDTNDKMYASSRDFFGVCFSDSLLFYNLSVKHQLMFFARMKGVNSTELKKEMNKYLEALELDNCRYIPTQQLTCGQRTKLAVACALIGGSKIILLDEIVLKLDVRDYDLIWRLLEKEKFGRVILTSTNLSQEPEIHADNLIVLAQGRLKCSGTSQFLKSMYCFGCHLVICKAENCKAELITNALSQYITDIEPTSDIGRELGYHIETSSVEIMESILDELEKNKDHFGIMNITIIETPVEELFSKLGAERPAYDDHRRYLRIFNGQSIIAENNDELVFLQKRINYKMHKFQKIINQWHATIYKYGKFYWAHKIIIPTIIGLPLFVIIYAAISMTPRMHPLPSLEFGPDEYGDSVTLLNDRGNGTNLAKFIEAYKQNIYWKNSNIKTINIRNETIPDHIINEERGDKYNNLNLKVILGLTLHNHMTAWFNGYLPHVAPTSLNLVYNAMLRIYHRSIYSIDVSIELLPMENSFAVEELSNVSFNMGSKLGVHMTFFLCYLVAIRVLIVVAERTSGFENLQRLAGLTSSNYWQCLFVLDSARHFIVVTVSTIASWLILPSTYFPVDAIRWWYGLLILACTATSSANYFLGLFFRSSHRAFLFITTLHVVGLAFYIAFYGVTEQKSIFLQILPRFFPVYSLCNGVQNIYEDNVRRRLCEDDTVKKVSSILENCLIVPKCCKKISLNADDDAMYLWLIIVNSWICVFVYENRHIFKRQIPVDNYDRALDEYKRRHASDSIEVDNVTAEMIRVQTMKPRMRYYYTAVCENLGLIKKGKVLVDRVSFTIKPGESIGIIGTNCNYTNALLNLLAGQLSPTFGRIFINSVSMTNDSDKARANIGYVPAVSCVMVEMTCYQVLKMFCILYGYDRKDIDEICENLSINFGFYSQFHTRLQYCSSGIRERVSYSIAILKKPALLCVGNYSWSVDPHGRRQLYRLLDALGKKGTALAITSVTNCFTELLCNKIVVMNEGQFINVGPPKEVAAQVAQGYVISMRMKKTIQTPQGVTPKVFFRLTAFMEKTFPSSQLVEEGAVMQYFIPIQSTTLALVFKNVRMNSFQLNIESLSISTMNMNFVFGRITEEVRRRSNT